MKKWEKPELENINISETAARGGNGWYNPHNPHYQGNVRPGNPGDFGGEAEDDFADLLS